MNQALQRADQIQHMETEGFYRTQSGLDQAIARGLAYAPYADLIWCETSEPDLEEAQRFAAAIHEKFPAREQTIIRRET